MSGPEVTKLQKFLVSQGMSIPSGPTGYFGNETKAAVTQWQQKTGVQAGADFGYWGPKSINTALLKTADLNKMTDARTGQPLNQPSNIQSIPNPTGSFKNGQWVPDSPGVMTPAATPPPAPVNYSDFQNRVDANGRSMIYQISQGRSFNPQDAASIMGANVDLSKIPTATYVPGSPGQGGGYAVGGSSQSTPSGSIPPSPQPTGPATMGKTPVILNNGITVYKDDRTGLYYDASGGQFSSESINKAMTQTSGGSSISPSDTRSDTTTDTSGTKIPDGLGVGDFSDKTIGNLPPEAWQNLIPQLTPGSSEYQAIMDKIDTSYFDILQQQMSANTEQEQQAAQYNWGQLKKNIEMNLGIKLADNALQAWDQIQGLGGQFNQQNIQGSGLQQEAMDNYLNRIRRSDALTRMTSQTEAETKEQDFYRKFATPEKIKAFVESSQGNRDRAIGWGLIPSDGAKSMAQRKAEMKEKYPNMSDQQIESGLATMYDANGFYRSNLYQKKMTGSNLSADPATVTTTYDQYNNPISKEATASDYGILDIDKAKERTRKAAIETENLRIDHVNRDRMGSTPPTTGAASAGPGGTQFNTPPKPDTTGTAAAGAAAANIGTNPSSTQPKPPVPVAIPEGTRTTGTGADTYVYDVPYTVNGQKRFYGGLKSGLPVST